MIDEETLLMARPRRHLTAFFQTLCAFKGHRIKDGLGHQRAMTWAAQKKLQMTMPSADSTGPGPTGSSAGSAVLTRYPSDKIDLSDGDSLPRSRAADAAAAFLQGRRQERVLYAKVPLVAADLTGIDPDALMELIKPARGQVDAPRRWWLRALDDLKASGLERRQLGPCVS